MSTGLEIMIQITDKFISDRDPKIFGSVLGTFYQVVEESDVDGFKETFDFSNPDYPLFALISAVPADERIPAFRMIKEIVSVPNKIAYSKSAPHLDPHSEKMERDTIDIILHYSNFLAGQDNILGW